MRAVNDFAGQLGVRTVRADSESSELTFDAGGDHLNPAGTVHGGVLATLVDSAMGAVARHVSGDGEVPATSQLTVTYLNPARTGPMVVTGRMRKRGKHLMVCDADVEQDGQPVVHAVATFGVVQR